MEERFYWGTDAIEFVKAHLKESGGRLTYRYKTGPHNNVHTSREVSLQEAEELLKTVENPRDSFSYNVSRYFWIPEEEKEHGRFLTKWYACTNRCVALQLARIDNTKEKTIETTLGVKPLHSASGWTYWSGGKMSYRTVNFCKSYRSLSDAAHSLIAASVGADGGHVDGGVLSLVDIEEILNETLFDVGRRRGHYAAGRLEILQVRRKSGSVQLLYVVTGGYFEGYSYDIYTDLVKAEEIFFKYEF